MIFSTWLRNWKRALDLRWALHQMLRREPGARRLASRLRLEALEDRNLLSAYVVTSGADSNAAGTLLYAINQVNAGNYNEIDFHIGNVGSAQTINLSTQLPTLTASGVYINGLSQGGPGNTTPLITLNGAGAPIHTDGLLVQGSSCTVSGLTVSNFGANGIEVEGANNLIGGSAAGAAMVITGNVGDGVKIDSGVSGNQVVGDYIGTNAAGAAGLGNGNGVEIVSANNTVGGLTATAGNVISDNNNDGVLIDHRASGVQVLGNYIGTNYAGNAALGNSVGIEVFGVNNMIGGTNPAAFNLISGSHADGVLIDSIGSGNQVLGNYIGTNADGTAALANGIGIEVAGVGNTVGGAVSGAFNLISGNSNDGVLIDSTSSGTQVLGNYIGTNFDGTAAVANSVGIEVAGISNTIGGASGARNLISGNSSDGVLIDSAANGNLLLGNYVGTNANGLAALANGARGIEIRGSNNTIGSSTHSAPNVISGNKGAGVLIDSGGNSNQLFGNYIGTTFDGGAALANGIGVEVGGGNNSIGSNEISGNIGDGVLIDSGGSGNLVFGNLIGSDSAAHTLGNSIGVEVGGSNNSINGNTISGNKGDGVLIDSGVSGIQLLGNYIGTGPNGVGTVANSSHGIEVAGNNNMIGGTGSGTRNIISGNSKDGVLIDSGASGNQVLGNYIGPEITGNTAVANSIGIELAGNGNTVGVGNVISGNSGEGVDIQGSGNQVLGNYIGTDSTGTKSLANGIGILVRIHASGNTIGGTTAGAGNLISGNSADGVQIGSDAGGNNQVLGNSIGVNASGAGLLGNGDNGIEIAGNNNAVGGTIFGARNVISGNNRDGVLIDGGASGNQVLNNYIGTDSTGRHPLANNIGVEIGGAGNTVGGAVSGASNLISGDNYAGMLISGSANQVLGNLIGVAAGGNQPLLDGTGIYIQNGSGNTIGGAVAGARNIISGNNTDGILITGGNNNQVLGNYIGTNADGSLEVANQHNGILVQSGSGNVIGGTASGAGNLISNNAGDGLLIAGSSTQVLGNTVGLNAAGDSPLGNRLNGIEVVSSGNIIGGTADGAGNVISGNIEAGLVVTGGDLVLGNYIGIAAAGNVALPNSVGIILGSNNTVGGAASGAGNVISGNHNDGVLINGSGNQVLGNRVGTSPGAVFSLGNSGNGIEVAGNNNMIGGAAAGARNFLSGNSKDGVLIDIGASGNQVVGNYVGLLADGTNAAPNSIGIEVAGNSNVVGGAASGAGNLISGNNFAGVLIAGSANQVLGNTLGAAANGYQPLANGTGIVLTGSGNTIGGSASGDRNIISGNHIDGVLLNGSGNQVLGNYIGADVNADAMGNGVNGIDVTGSGNTIGGAASGAGNLIALSANAGVLLHGSGNQVLGNHIGINPGGDVGLENNIGIDVEGSGNTVGGTASGAGNLISGNSSDGLLINGSGSQVLGNYIGIAADGNTQYANGSSGIVINGSGNTIGGTVSGAGNLISGNDSGGVLLNGSGNQVLGNLIGTNKDGTAALPNSGNGIAIAGSSNVIGGTVAGAGNFISGNSGDGVKITGSGNQVLGNAVGVNATGTAALGNSGNGIEVAGSNNTIGAATTALRSLISGNSGDGVLIDSTASGNLVLGNDIGTDATRTKPLANNIGVEVDGAGNTVGGTASGASNLISGDNYAGMLISGSANQVLGNLIGVALGGNSALLNGTGIYVKNGSGNTIGGTAAGARNIISGNNTDGMLITGGNNNQVLGNYIGTNADGTAALTNHHNGIFVSSGSGNMIGGTASGAGNLISGNTNDGVVTTGSSTQVLGNSIGVNISGAGLLGNSGNGIEIGGNNNTVGGTAAGAGNLISGNGSDGVKIDGGGSGNLVLGNFIGTNVQGLAALANSIGVELDGTGNTVGGAASGADNLISGDNYAGLLISGSANQVLGNLIGVALGGNSALLNGTGIVLGGSGNSIGGTVSGARNILSGNNTDGMLITGGNNNQVLGNYIGTDAAGSAALANLHNGIYVLSGSGNTIGGTASGAGNVISGNSRDGVRIDSGSNLVLGNFIGTNYAGTESLGTDFKTLGDSIGVEVVGTNNVVGGSASGARNIISGNSTDGVLIDNSASGNQVLGSYIGVGAHGNALSNITNGIEVVGSSNTVGGATTGAGNFISGNRADGVLIDSTASNNLVVGNSIGANVNGNGPLANSGNGIEIGGSGNTVGGAVSAARNLISGNSKDGLLITGNGNQVLGNYVGTESGGNVAVPNSFGGIRVDGANNSVGGAAGTGNLISGNSGYGVLLDGSGNQVLSNYIGTNAAATVTLGNSGNGIEVGGGSGSVASRNVISGNTQQGVLIDPTSSGNQVLGNYIGTDAAGTAVLGNGGYGIAILSNGNTVSKGNLISNNNSSGVDITDGHGNSVRQDSIFANGPTGTGPGITLHNGNNNVAAPSLSSATLSGTTLTVMGAFTAAAANVSYFLDFYANPSGDPEGKVLLGSLTVTPTSTGTQSFTFMTTTTETGTNPLITVTLTDASGNTSAFSNGVTTGSSVENSPQPNNPPAGNQPPTNSPTGSSPTSSSPVTSSTPTLSPVQEALEVALDTAALLLQSNVPVLLELEGLSVMLLGQNLPQPSDLLSTILSDLRVSGSAGFLGLQLGMSIADSLIGTTK